MLLHYTEQPFVLDTTRIYTQSHQQMKPVGLWVSIEGDESYGWKNWCKDNDFGAERLVNCSEIILQEEASILHIKTAIELDRFSNQFKSSKDPFFDDLIDWEKVAIQYQGIIIAPYQWSRRLDRRMFWYYGWDCASGCIWDCAAIQSANVYRHSEVVKS